MLFIRAYISSQYILFFIIFNAIIAANSAKVKIQQAFFWEMIWEMAGGGIEWIKSKN